MWIHVDIWINLDDVGILPLWWNCQYEKCVQNLCHSTWYSLVNGIIQFMDEEIPKIFG